jgi:aminoglycoside phosphotransferase (APT) family kinase protein
MELAPADTLALTASLARMGLIEPDERPTLIPLAGGISSLIVRAETKRGPVCVKRALPQLKVAAPWFAPVERNAAELCWMRVASAAAPGSVPQIVGHDERAHLFAMVYFDPAAYPIWKAQLRDGIVELATARAVGARLAAIHNSTARRADIARDFANDETFLAIRLEPYFGATAKVHEDCAPALQRLIEVTANTKLVLVHGDVSPKNILAGPDGPVFLDAECAWYGDPAFDLAFCLNHLLLKCLWRPASTSAFLASFDALAQSYLAAVQWEPVGELETRTAAMLPGMLLARVDGKSPVEYLTAESDRDRVRSFAKPLVREPVKTLAEIRRRWAEQRAQ